MVWGVLGIVQAPLLVEGAVVGEGGQLSSLNSAPVGFKSSRFKLRPSYILDCILVMQRFLMKSHVVGIYWQFRQLLNFEIQKIRQTSQSQLGELSQ